MNDNYELKRNVQKTISTSFTFFRKEQVKLEREENPNIKLSKFRVQLLLIFNCWQFR